MIDLAAEKAVLAGPCLFGEESYLDIADLLTAKSFTNPTNQILYRCIDNAYSIQGVKSLDLPTLLSSAHSLGLKDMISGKEELKFVKSLWSVPVDKGNIRKLAAKVRKLEIAELFKVQLLRAGRDLDGVTGEESIAHIIGLAENPIFDLTSLLNTAQEGPVPLTGDLDKYLDYLESNPVKQIGLPTGYPTFDRVTGGLRRSGIMVIVGRAKSAKTTSAINIGANIALNLRIPVLYGDTEMLKEDHQHKILSRLSGVSINEIETGQYALSSEKKLKVRKAAAELKNAPYKHISICGQPLEETLSMMRRWIKTDVGYKANGEANDCLIIYDYLKMMDDSFSKNLQEYQAIGFLTTSLHNFAKRHSVPILALGQTNRDGLNKEDISVVAGADRISWFAQSVSLFKAFSDDELAENQNEFNRKMIVLAARYGEPLDFGDYINFKMEGKFGRITEGPTRGELMKDTFDTPTDNNIKF